MERRSGRVVRSGRVYRFTINEVEYAVFVWQVGSQFCGRVDGHPQVPEQKAHTALGVRDALYARLQASI